MESKACKNRLRGGAKPVRHSLAVGSPISFSRAIRGAAANSSSFVSEFFGPIAGVFSPKSKSFHTYCIIYIGHFTSASQDCQPTNDCLPSSSVLCPPLSSVRLPPSLCPPSGWIRLLLRLCRHLQRSAPDWLPFPARRAPYRPSHQCHCALCGIVLLKIRIFNKKSKIKL